MFWSSAALCRRRHNVHKHRNLLAHAPERLHEELSADYRDLIYAETSQESEAKRKAFVRKRRLKSPAVASSFEEAGDKLFTFVRFPKSQWKSIRTTDEVDKRNLRRSAICGSRERPRDEARRTGCKRRQASYSFLAGLRRSRASPLGRRVFQRSTKRA
jgi:transposase-like protein